MSGGKVEDGLDIVGIDELFVVLLNMLCHACIKYKVVTYSVALNVSLVRCQFAIINFVHDVQTVPHGKC